MNRLKILGVVLLLVCTWSYFFDGSPAYAGVLRERFKNFTARKISEKGRKDALNAEKEYGVQRFELLHEGRKRSYFLYVPKKESKAYPLVFMIHGGGGMAVNAIRMADMNGLAEEDGFMVAYPNGTGPYEDALLTFNAGNCCGYARQNEVNDVGFFRAMIDDIGRRFPVDPKRIFATGLSNGGKMAYRLAYELSDKFAAIAPVAGSFDFEDLHPVDPVSVLIFHGTEDRHILYEGGAPKKAVDTAPRVDKSVAYAVSFWARNNGCDPTPLREKTGNIIHDVYAKGQGGAEVQVYTIVGQGHSWPGGKKGLRFGNADPPTQEISATKLIWEFFKTQPKS